MYFINCKLKKKSHIVLNKDSTIKDLDQEGTYKYLGKNERTHSEEYYKE